jgi:hypothetical protein
MSSKLQKDLNIWTGRTLTGALLGVGVVTILIALFVKNKWVKAGVLAFEVLP